jgi:uncharacterized lipoprotein YddW (UPF0748 family)
MRHLLFILFAGVIFNSAKTQNLQPKHEFRAVWVATVNNIDWPSAPGLSTEQQQSEARLILDRHSYLGMNAIIFQVRPAADAFYQSEFEPWSRYLTGIPGKAPESFYDPLAFWIEECHNRGMEFHAWLNPFRLAQNYLEPLAGNHIAFEHPEWVIKYGNCLYFDPGIPDVTNYLAKVVKDIVSRYDVDAIHFDDYFYPYPLKGEDFPDEGSFAKYNRGYRLKAKGDWRRENVDFVISTLSDTIKKTKPWVKFGISPFGVWRNKSDDPNGSETTGGTSNYEHLYADVLKWQRNGWIDYSIPQIYWQIGHPKVDFNTLANWWAANSNNKAIYIGHAVYKSDKNADVREWISPEELPNQLKALRGTNGIEGSAFFSSRQFNRDLMGFQDSLKQTYYKYPAIVPSMKWIDNQPPKPVEHLRKSGSMLKWKADFKQSPMDDPAYFVVYLNEKGVPFNPENPEFIISVQKETECTFKSSNRKKKNYEVRISVLDRLYNESQISEPVILKL